MKDNPKLSNKPLSKETRKELLQISSKDVTAAVVKAKRSLNALVQAETRNG